MARVEYLQTKLEELLQCSICLDIYSDPKMLQCFHVFCHNCIAGLVHWHQLTCPTCRQVTVVPPGGVTRLQSAYRVNDMKEIQSTFKALSQEASVDSLQCSVHQENKLELYCETCRELICLRCAYIGSKHHTHTHQDIDGAFQWYDEHLRPKQKQELNSLNNKLTAVLGTIEESLMEEPAQGSSSLEESIIHRHTTLNSVKEGVQATKGEVASILELCRIQLDKKRALRMRNEVSRRIMEVTAALKFSFLKLRAPDPSLCQAKGSTKLAVLRDRSTVTLTVLNFMRKGCKVPDKCLECRCVSSEGGEIKCKVEKTGENTYNISYRPVSTHQLTLSVTISGRHIRGSPFTIAVRPPAERFGYPFIFPLGDLHGLCRVTSKGYYKVVVSEQGNDRVSLFNILRGTKLQSFGCYGYDEGQFNSPCGVTMDGMGNILVADCGNHRIQKFTAKGVFMSAIGELGSGEQQFYCPSDIAYNITNNKLYVVDKNHRVQVLNSGLAFYKTCWNNYRLRVVNSDLTFSSIFGTIGTGPGQFNDPQGIACDSTGEVYVADSGNHRVQVFTAEGKFLRMFNVLGGGTGELEYPVGIAIDSNDRVYIGECGRVSVLTPQCDHRRTLDRETGKFANISGMAVSSIGVLYLSDGNGVHVVTKTLFSFKVLAILLTLICGFAFFITLLWAKHK